MLLVGDADIMPVRYMVLDRVTPTAYDYAFYPSDLYYADVARRDGSFDDWNVRKDGFHASYFGEVRGEKNKADPINFDRIDYRPELAVGRWPADSTAEVELLVEKTITQDRANLAMKGKTARTAAFIYVSGWVDARGQMDRWVRELPAGWKSSKLYSGAPRSESPDENHVASLLNAGTSLVFHVGHGEDNGWVHSINVGTLSRLRNEDRLPVVLSAGCSTARFATLPPYEAYEDIHGGKHIGTNAGEVFSSPPPPPSPYARGKFNHTGLGELMVRRGMSGAVAYIGCNTGGQPCGLTLLEGFVRSLRDLPEPTLGDCWAAGLALLRDVVKRLKDLDVRAGVRATSAQAGLDSAHSGDRGGWLALRRTWFRSRASPGEDIGSVLIGEAGGRADEGTGQEDCQSAEGDREDQISRGRQASRPDRKGGRRSWARHLLGGERQVPSCR